MDAPGPPWLTTNSRPTLKAESTSSSVLTVLEVARALSLSRGATYAALRSGQIPSLAIGRRRIIPRAAFERFLESAIATEKPPVR